MFEAVHASPDGESTVARYALTAARLGYEGVVVRNHSNFPSSFDREGICDKYDIDIVHGVEIRAPDPQRASGYIGSVRPSHTIVLLHGGTNELNRFAVEQDRIDVLAHPTRGGGEINHVLVREAARNGVRIEFDFSTIIRSNGGPRVQSITNLRLLHRLIDKYNTPYVVSVDPSSHLHLRAPREVQAVGTAIGIESDWIAEGLWEWGRLAERNRNRMTDSFIEPGVERGSYESDE